MNLGSFNLKSIGPPLVPPPLPIILAVVDNSRPHFQEEEKKQWNDSRFFFQKIFIHFRSGDISFWVATWCLLVNKTIINSERSDWKIYFAPKSFWIDHFVSDASHQFGWQLGQIFVSKIIWKDLIGKWKLIDDTQVQLIKSEISMKRIWSQSSENFSLVFHE